jgi:hypothetical protein
MRRAACVVAATASLAAVAAITPAVSFGREGLLAHRVLRAGVGGVVKARNGAALLVPRGALREDALVSISEFRGGRFDFNISGEWKGAVRVTLPRRHHSVVMHSISGSWVPEGTRGVRTVWVTQLSVFSWLGSLGSKVKTGLCLTRNPLKFVQCLIGKGLSKIDSTLVKWVAGLTGVSSQCTRALIASSKGILSEMVTILTSSDCREHAGETPVPGTVPGPSQTPSPGPSQGPSPPPGDSGGGEPPPNEAPSPPSTWSETTGGAAHTWTNYTNAGGYEGPTIPSNATVQIACRLTGFAVADGNTWWYRIASAPWSGNYYVSADAFYNNGQTSGSLKGTPFVDPAVGGC